nr:retropepsin-like aspartic protease [Candidatus Njordarchaeota archaeon]
MLSRKREGTIVCRYLSFYDQRLKTTFRLPLVHIRIKQGNVALKTDALIDSGATSTFIPLELAEVLTIELSKEKHDFIGAGGTFSSYVAKVDLIEVLKGVTPFYEFKGILVTIPAAKGTLPYCVLGRDSIFRKYHIIFKENEEYTVFKVPKNR